MSDRGFGMDTPSKVPVTILTGFLGSGKTTLLNRILTEEHGKRIAVVENEFGEVGIDQALVINADEEIFEMSNGCICCTVRGDLIRVLNNLNKRRDKFDYVLVETTGLARSWSSRSDVLHGRRDRCRVFARRNRHTRRCRPHRAATRPKRRKARSKSRLQTFLCSTRRTWSTARRSTGSKLGCET